MPFPRDLIPGRAALERLGLETAVVLGRPAGGDGAAAPDQPDAGPALRPDELRAVARPRRRDRATALDGQPGRAVGIRPRCRGQFLGGLRDQREHALRPRSGDRARTLAGQPRHAPVQHAGLRRVAGHGRDDQRVDRRPSPEVPGSEGERASLRQAHPALELSRGDRDPHPAAPGREPGRLRRGRQQGLGRDGRRADGHVPVRHGGTDRRRARGLRHAHPAHPLRGQGPLRRRPVHWATSSGPSPRVRRSPRSRWWPGRTSTSSTRPGTSPASTPRPAAVRWTIPTQGGRLVVRHPDQDLSPVLQPRPVRRGSRHRAGWWSTRRGLTSAPG